MTTQNYLPLATLANLPRLPVLSIRQPWAWLILHAGKDIENRTWKTPFRGRFLIHAAKGCTNREYFEAADFATEALGDKPLGKPLPPPSQLPRGGIVGYADIVDCLADSDSPWFCGPYGFALKNATPLEFLPYKGQLGFFNLKDHGREQ